MMDVLAKGFTNPTQRILALRDAIYDATPTVEADRAELVTASYKETEACLSSFAAARLLKRF